jgi:hypothetical protein
VATVAPPLVAVPLVRGAAACCLQGWLDGAVEAGCTPETAGAVEGTVVTGGTVRGPGVGWAAGLDSAELESTAGCAAGFRVPEVSVSDESELAESLLSPRSSPKAAAHSRICYWRGLRAGEGGGSAPLSTSKISTVFRKPTRVGVLVCSMCSRSSVAF